MKYQAFSPVHFGSRVKSPVGSPILRPSTPDGTTILHGPVATVRQQADQLKRGGPFNVPRIELWEQEVGLSHFPHQPNQARAIILSGKDVFSFCREFNQGHPLREEGDVKPKRNPFQQLLDWLFPKLKQERAKKRVKDAIRREDELIQHIKRFAATQKGIAPLAELGPSSSEPERKGLLTYLRVE